MSDTHFNKNLFQIIFRIAHFAVHYGLKIKKLYCIIFFTFWAFKVKQNKMTRYGTSHCGYCDRF